MVQILCIYRIFSKTVDANAPTLTMNLIKHENFRGYKGNSRKFSNFESENEGNLYIREFFEGEF